MDDRKCRSCKKLLDADNKTAVCNEDCFYQSIYWGNDEEGGVLGSPYLKTDDARRAGDK